MKKPAGKILFTLIVLAVFVFSCVYASASPANADTIAVGDVQNGTVEVKVDPADASKALITLSPDKGYLAAAVGLTAKDGTAIALEKTETNVYTCDIPAEESTLTASFRLARVTLNKTELAMRSGSTFTVTAKLGCTDGELDTRDDIIDRGIVFASTNPEVVSIDPVTGVMTAHKMGYARITANAAAGNKVFGYFYVIVDGDKSLVVGTIQLNAHFDEKLFVETLLPGHSFLLFTNTSGHDITIDVPDFYRYDVPTDKFYNTVDSYDGTGYDPVTYYYATNGEYQNEDNLEVREAYAEGFFTRYTRGELKTYTIKPNDIATFGNTGESIGIEDSNFDEVLARYGKSFALEKIKAELLAGTIDVEEYLYRVAELVNEVLYDTTTGYNPFNGYAEGGETLNGEMASQVKSRSYVDAAACRTKITEVQLMAMVDYVQFGQYGNGFSILERNCTSVATGAWNLVTAAKPQYNLLPNVGSVTNALAAPLFLRNNILSMGVMLSGDPEIEFFNGIDVIKPAKGLGVGCEHHFENGKCTECGAAEPGYTPTVTFLSFFTRILDSIRNMFAGMFSWLPFC